jgi:phosphoglycerate dehydrogenase-like enzyme
VFRVVLAEGLDGPSEQRLAAAATVVRLAQPDEATLCAAVADADALIVRTHTRVTAAVLGAGQRLRVVGIAGVGLDQVDTAAAAARGITVLSRTAAATDAVAELTLAFMLTLLRPIPRLMAAYRAGQFRAAREAAHGRELRELAIGIVGMGRIGSAVGRICASGIGARVLYTDIRDVGALPFAATAVDKPTLWAGCDVVTVHVPLTDATRGLVDAAVLGQMPPGALLINTARGPVVRTDALVTALESGQLGGAALDVTDPEPLPPEHPLWRCERCLLTPHIAARTFGGLARMCGIVDDVLDALRANAE